MKSVLIPFLILTLYSVAFFNINTFFDNEDRATENWYLCSYCCKTKKATSAPWEQGCRVSSSGTHNYQFSGKAGNFNYTCRKCDAEVYLTSSTTPSASKCCATGTTHTWYHK
jgi:hypothetical protein